MSKRVVFLTAEELTTIETMKIPPNKWLGDLFETSFFLPATQVCAILMLATSHGTTYTMER